MGDTKVTKEGIPRLELPYPTKMDIGPTMRSHSAEAKAEEEHIYKETKDMMKDFLFPLR